MLNLHIMPQELAEAKFRPRNTTADLKLSQLQVSNSTNTFNLKFFFSKQQHCQ